MGRGQSQDAGGQAQAGIGTCARSSGQDQRRAVSCGPAQGQWRRPLGGAWSASPGPQPQQDLSDHPCLRLPSKMFARVRRAVPRKVSTGSGRRPDAPRNSISAAIWYSSVRGILYPTSSVTMSTRPPNQPPPARRHRKCSKTTPRQTHAGKGRAAHPLPQPGKASEWLTIPQNVTARAPKFIRQGAPTAGVPGRRKNAGGSTFAQSDAAPRSARSQAERTKAIYMTKCRLSCFRIPGPRSWIHEEFTPLSPGT